MTRKSRLGRCGDGGELGIHLPDEHSHRPGPIYHAFVHEPPHVEQLGDWEAYRLRILRWV